MGTLAGSWHLRLAAKYHSGSPRSVPTLSHQAKSDGCGAKGLARAGDCGQGPGEVVVVAVVVVVVAAMPSSATWVCAGGCRCGHRQGWWLQGRGSPFRWHVGHPTAQHPTAPAMPAPPWLHSHASLSLQPGGTARHAQTQPAFGTHLHAHTNTHAQACTCMHTHMHSLPNAHGVQAPADAGPVVPIVEAQPCRSTDDGAFVCQAPPRPPRPHARHRSALSPPACSSVPTIAHTQPEITAAISLVPADGVCSSGAGEPGTGAFCPWEPDPITLCRCG